MCALQIHNSLSREKQTFTPIKDGEVRMYVCGPTVYNFIHVGNARPLIFFDVVRRFLEYEKYRVTFVMNFTDVDDKIIQRAREEKCAAVEVSEKYCKEYLTDMSLLGIQPATVQPKVTQHIETIIKFIEGLIINGTAYTASDGEVFFSVRKFKEYGKLSGKQIDDLRVGARVDPNEKKNDPLDFSLWKPQKAQDEPSWNSPWGKGRPGWHIECSAMAMQYLGETFDIHGGGMDLIHPHHENEIAQSEGLTGKPFARYWMHNNMLTMDREKMSKSLGNIILAREFIQKYGAETLKFLLLSGHYRSTIDFSVRHIRECQAGLHRIYSAMRKAETFAPPKAPIEASPKPTPEEEALTEFSHRFSSRWVEAMEDDFNTAKTVSFVFEYVRAVNSYFDRKGFKPTPHTPRIGTQFLEEIRSVGHVLNLFEQSPSHFLETLKACVLTDRNLKASEIEEQIQARATARAQRNFSAADDIRSKLLAKGIELRDSPQGTEWDIVFTAE